MREKVGLCFLLVRFNGSNEDGAEIRGRRGRGRALGHGYSFVTAVIQRNHDQEPANTTDGKVGTGV